MKPSLFWDVTRHRLVFENGTHMLSLNVGYQPPNYARVTSQKNESLNYTAEEATSLVQTHKTRFCTLRKANSCAWSMCLCCFLDDVSVCMSVYLTGSLAWLTVLRINPYTKASHFLGNPPSSSVTHSPPTCYQHPFPPTPTRKGRQGKLQLLYT
jgi:hypothetical protein